MHCSYLFSNDEAQSKVQHIQKLTGMLWRVNDHIICLLNSRVVMSPLPHWDGRKLDHCFGIAVCCVGLRICCRPELSRRMSSFVEDLEGFFLQWACQLLRSVMVRWFKGEVEASKEATTLPHLLYSRMVIKEAESCSFLPLFKWFIGLSESSNWL